MLAKLSTSDALHLLHGVIPGWIPFPYVGMTPGLKKFGIPPLHMNDGPQGYRAGVFHRRSSTQFPSGLAVASTWDADAARLWGEAMGAEFVAKGANVQLGPGLCVSRVPTNGRAFEYLSGEEPLLGAVLGAAAIEGIQSTGVMANAKHWVLNSQEDHRRSISDDASERTRFELYYPPFEAAIRAGVSSLMCSYNRLNGTYSCEHDATLRVDLRERLGFDGFVMSDWGATHSSAPSANATLDMEMPADGHYYRLPADIRAGRTSDAVVRQLAMRVLTQMYRFGMFDPGYAPNRGKVDANVSSAASRAVAHALATNATILLQNGGALLPLTPRTGLRVAVSGAQARRHVISGGGGSGAVVPTFVQTPADALAARLAACNGSMTLVERDEKAAAAAAAAADVAVVFVATTSAEGRDRPTLGLGGGQDGLVRAVAAANNRTIVCVVSPGAVLLPWRADVAAILLQVMPGQQMAGALADVLFGAAEPSGRLPFTLPTRDNEQNFTAAQYPGVDGHSTYSEGLLVGYRWYDAHGVPPAYPFGHGLGYTHFRYSRLEVASAASTDLVEARTEAPAAEVVVVSPRAGALVRFVVSNVGRRAGTEVAQVYLGFPPHAGEPPLLLRAFRRLTLAAGAAHTVAVNLTARDLSVWDEEKHAWAVVRGNFTVAIGASSRDVRLRASFVV